jgi:hypothetical protein
MFTSHRYGWSSVKTFNRSYGFIVERISTKEHRSMDIAHWYALQAKHTGLEGRIAAEAARPLPDTSLIATLKKQKLRIKDAIAQLKR